MLTVNLKQRNESFCGWANEMMRIFSLKLFKRGAGVPWSKMVQALQLTNPTDGRAVDSGLTGTAHGNRHASGTETAPVEENCTCDCFGHVQAL